MSIAVLTMVYNESVFLPIWLNHYGPAFGLENLYVIDDGSTDGSTADPRILNRLAKRRTVLDETDRASLVSHVHAALLGRHECVIYTDVDELIVLDPRAGNDLAAHLGASAAPILNPVGMNVVHRLAREAPVDLAVPLFHQRGHVQSDIGYSKPAIARVPMRWGPGFHQAQAASRTDPSLILFHLRAMDRDLSRARVRHLNTIAFSQRSIQAGQTVQFRLDEAAYIREFFPAPDARFEAASASEELAGHERSGDKPADADGRIFQVPARFRDSIRLNAAPIAAAPAVPAGERDTRRADNAALMADAIEAMIRADPHRRRGDTCPCGSGRLFRKCHARIPTG